MRDLSLHILDLIENSIRAQATAIAVTIAAYPEEDRLEVIVEDNGPGLNVSPEVATDPFYTTKEGKRTGLGLSLMRAAAEQAGGELTLSKSSLGGLAVKATMQLSHIDRSPLGDLAATFSSVACTNPDLDLLCRFRMGKKEEVVRVADIAKQVPHSERGGLSIARHVHEKVKAALAFMEIT